MRWGYGGVGWGLTAVHKVGESNLLSRKSNLQSRARNAPGDGATDCGERDVGKESGVVVTVLTLVSGESCLGFFLQLTRPSFRTANPVATKMPDRSPLFSRTAPLSSSAQIWKARGSYRCTACCCLRARYTLLRRPRGHSGSPPRSQRRVNL